MRFRTLEIRWNDSKPISSCDFQPVPVKKARPPPNDPRAFGGQSYRLATGGEDNHVRVWMVYPHIRPPGVEDESISRRPARVEYLATLSRHSAAVNVVRFSPNGELIASAGDDGMVIIWAQSASPQTTTYGSDLSAEDLQYEKEYWKPRTTFRCTTMQVYDLAWSPTGEYLLTGSTDNTARVFAAADGKCVHEIAEHSHYVQGVAWDPLNEYIATQSSDRSMHVYRISTSKGSFEAHAVGRNTRFPTHTPTPRAHSRTPSIHRDESILSASSTEWSRPLLMRSQSIESDREREPGLSTPFPPTPVSMLATASINAAMFPPPPAGTSSRRSSFSGSNAPSSPGFSRAHARSPSPMPALPAIRTPPSASAGWAGRYDERSRSRSRYDERRYTDGARMYGDEGYSNFFRRLAFSPDGGLLLTPAGTFEDPSASVPGWENADQEADAEMSSRGRKARSSTENVGPAEQQATNASNSTVYIYSRANFARPPVAQLPGHKKASVAVRFNPVLFDLRPGVLGGTKSAQGTATGAGDGPRDVEENIEVDITGPSSSASPTISPVDSSRPPSLATPVPSNPSSPRINAIPLPPPPHSNLPGTGSIFALPYRMLYAVVTMDTLAIYDTQQAGPICLLTKLHYDEFTDLSWSPDGQCLIVSSRDGYCTLVTFDEILPPHHTQQTVLQLQQIAAAHSMVVPGSTPATPSLSGRKRPLEPLTPAASVDGDRESIPPLPANATVDDAGASGSKGVEGEKQEGDDGPPKKKRRVALTRVGDL
ncbi:WD-REPEATS-REGION domain-containing protein [Mycena indigotica]|uniref:WD-REPEATS-REGION domain-containing protein n=1 Tax=Mycena indigotica TaxID=2126181 RepID=A0A8H6SZS9_9AGAR|nr:WD-REPEATS-REGION domain-containing protein [Mycena indigotica]KAF7309320.1 WD-REPEATS-REGION domain-containing protein [Mycena indigotica]